MRHLLPLLCLTLVGAAAAGAPTPLFSVTPLPSQRCGAVPVAGLNLTAAERELLPYICWPPAGDEAAGLQSAGAPLRSRGVPAGVNCSIIER